MLEPKIVIEASPTGIARIRIDRTHEGLSLLRRVLPLVPELNRRLKKPQKAEGTHA